jgi:hypothetical protein
MRSAASYVVPESSSSLAIAGGRALTIANIHGRPCSPVSGSPALRQRPPISELENVTVHARAGVWVRPRRAVPCRVPERRQRSALRGRGVPIDQPTMRGSSSDSPLEESGFEPLVPLATEMLIELARGITNPTRMLAVGDIGPVSRQRARGVFARNQRPVFVSVTAHNALFLHKTRAPGPPPGDGSSLLASHVAAAVGER